MISTSPLYCRQGQAADWAKQYIESGHYEGSGRLTRVNVTEEDASAALQDCTKIVSATGFDRNPLPEISIDGEPLQDLGHDRHSGAIIPGEHGLESSLHCCTLYPDHQERLAPSRCVSPIQRGSHHERKYLNIPS